MVDKENSFEWKLFSPTLKYNDWDSMLQDLDGHNIFQSSLWGNYKKCNGWIPRHIILLNSDREVIYAFQALSKIIFKLVNIIWVPGGISYHSENAKKINIQDAIRPMIKASIGENTIYNYFRINFCQNGYFHNKIYKNRILFKPKVKINSGLTIIIDINKTDEELLMSMRKKHRYYVRKALKENLQWDYSINEKNINDYFYAQNIMVENKGLKSQLLSLEDFKLLFNHMSDSIVMISGRYKEQLVSACVIFIFGNKAFYYKAVTTTIGRERNSSYAMIFKSIIHLKSLGITKFDFGGIDPDNIKAKGVDHFKKGFGGYITDDLGELDWSKNILLRLIMNIGISYKKNNF